MELPNGADFGSGVVRDDDAKRLLHLHHEFDRVQSHNPRLVTWHGLHGGTGRSRCPVEIETFPFHRQPKLDRQRVVECPATGSVTYPLDKHAGAAP